MVNDVKTYILGHVIVQATIRDYSPPKPHRKRFFVANFDFFRRFLQ